MFSRSSTRIRSLFYLSVFLLILVLSPSTLSSPQNEMVDRIAAVVNDQVITLTDLGIVDDFGLVQSDQKDQESRRLEILNKLIDQKLVLQLSPSAISETDASTVSFIQSLKQKMGGAVFQRKLKKYGMQEKDIQVYVQEKIAYQEVIAQKFQRGVIVSLKEIETYYREVYAPAQREMQKDPIPMMDVLDDIETILRDKKIRKRVEDWLSLLRAQAEIHIMLSKRG